MIPNNIMQILNRTMPNANVQNIKTPDDLAQMLLNSGRVSQAQVNQARQMWGQQPNIRQMIKNRFGI